MEVEGAGAAVEGVEAETPTWIKRVIRAPWRYFRVRFTFDDVAVRVDAPLCKTVRCCVRIAAPPRSPAMVLSSKPM